MPRRLLIAGAGLLVLWAAVGWLVVPRIVEARLVEALEESLDARAEVSAVRFQPFLIDLELEGFVLTGPTAAAEPDRIVLDHLHVDLQAATLLEFAPVVAVTARGLRAELSRDAQGALTLADLPRPPAPDAPDTQSDTPTEPVRALVDLTIEGSRVVFADRSVPDAPTLTVDLNHVALTDLDTAAPTHPATLQVRIGGDLGVMAVNGTLQPAPAADLRLQLTGTELSTLEPWLASTTPLTGIAGQLALETRVRTDGRTLEWSDARLDLDGARVVLPDQTFGAAGLNLSGVSGRVDTAAPADARAAFDRLELTVVELEVGGPASLWGRLQALRLDVFDFSDGALAVDALALQAPELTVTLAAADADARTEADAKVAEGATPGEADAPSVLPGGLRLGSLAVTDLALALADPSTTPPAAVALQDGTVYLGPVTLDAAFLPAAPVTLDLALAQDGPGRIRFSGAAAPGTDGAPSLDGTLDVEALDLAPLGPWLQDAAGIELRGARLGTHLEVTVDAAVRATGTGTARVDGVRIRDADGVPVLGFEAVELDGIAVDTDARTVALERLGLASPRLRFARYQDGRTNLDGIGPTADAAPPTEDAEAEEAPPWRWQLGGLELTEGYLDFVDETLLTSFATTVEGIEGRAGPVSDSAPVLDLTVAGRVPPVGRLGAEARVDVLAPTDDGRLRLEFDRMSLRRLSPWTSTFAGYDLQAGELGLRLDYRVAAGQLEATNEIVLESLELGERVESERAADLPLELAIALLRDGDGRIELDVPVAGDLTDPSFDVTPAILRALRGAIAGVATAPFRALGSLVGARRPLDGVNFEFGDDTADASAREVLDDVARVLDRRPGLALTVAPLHAGQPDLDALRVARLDAELAATGEPRPMAIAGLARAAFGNEMIDDIRAQYGDVEDADAAMTGELAGLLLARVQVGVEALDALAGARGAAVVTHLVAAGVDPARIVVGPVEERSDLATEAVRLPFSLQPAARRSATSPAAPTPDGAP